MIVDNINSFVFGVKTYPEWFRRVNVEYTYGEDGVTLIGAVIRNPSGELLRVAVGDVIVRVQETYRGTVCLVLPKTRKRR